MIDPAIQDILTQATDLCDDSRRVIPGAVFVARAGHKQHGLAGLAEAIDRGAMAVIHDGLGSSHEQSKLADLDVPVIKDESLNEHVVDWLNAFFQDPTQALTLHAVTGTNGKSSIAWLLAQALDGAMIGTLGVGRPGEQHPSDLTTPSIFCIYRQLAGFKAQGIRHVVIEASSHALVQGRLKGLSFHTTVFTNLGHDHLDYHGDRVAYGEAKRLLFTNYPSAYQLFNLDDAFGESLYEEATQSQLPTKAISCGYTASNQPDAEVKVISHESAQADGGLDVEVIVADGSSLHFQSQLVGQVNAYNLAVCAQVMHSLHYGHRAIETHLASLKPVPGRMERILPDTPSVDNGPSVIVDYAHTPDALRRALQMVRPMCSGQLWCIFGCGGDRDISKRAPMGRLAESLADRVVLTDDNPRHESSLAIIRSIQTGMRHPERARVLPDRAEAIAYAIAQAGTEDLVLIAGKGHETEQIIGDLRLPLNDRVLAAQALSKWTADHQEAC